MKVTLEIPDAVMDELIYLVKLQQQHGAINPHASVASLLTYVASAVADGSRRPGCWERELLQMMGLIPNTPEAQEYRKDYGAPLAEPRTTTDSEGEDR